MGKKKMDKKNIGVVIGSLRKDSLNRKMAKNLIAMAPDSLSFRIIEIKDLSLYDQDLDENPPAAWTEFRSQLGQCDGFLFVTPEYNRSVPGVLKNAVDIGSRPNGQNSWNAKPGAVISVSPGAAGGVSGSNHLRQTLMALNVHTMAQPEAYIGSAGNLFGTEGEIINEGTKKFVKTFIDSFAEWVAKDARS